MSSIYNSIEFNKMLMDVVEDESYITTYVGTARYAIPPYQDCGYRTDADKGRPIWMIRRDVFEKATGAHDYSYPYLDTDFKYVWNDRATYDYDKRKEPGTVDGAIMLNDTDYLITEDGQYLGLEVN